MNEEINTIKLPSSGKTHLFNPDLKPVAWSEIREQIAPQGIKLDAEELIDQKFVLLRMKKFPSKYEEQDHAYYCVGQTVKGKELFNTVLGGSQPMEVLDCLMDAEYPGLIEFTLTWHEGGAYKGYYTLD